MHVCVNIEKRSRVSFKEDPTILTSSHGHMKSVATHVIVSSSEQFLHIWQTTHIKVDRRGWDMVSPSTPLPAWWPTIGRKLPSPAAPWEVKGLNPKLGTLPLKTCTWEMSPQTSPFESQWNWHLQDPPGSWSEKQLLKGSMNLVTLLGPGTGTVAEKGPDFLWKRLVYLKASAWGASLSFNTLWGLGGWQEPSLLSLPHSSWTVSPRKELVYLSGALMFAVAAQRQL